MPEPYGDARRALTIAACCVKTHLRLRFMMRVPFEK